MKLKCELFDYVTENGYVFSGVTLKRDIDIYKKGHFFDDAVINIKDDYIAFYEDDYCDPVLVTSDFTITIS